MKKIKKYIKAGPFENVREPRTEFTSFENIGYVQRRSLSKKKTIILMFLICLVIFTVAGIIPIFIRLSKSGIYLIYVYI